MVELLTAHPQSLLIAIVLAIGIDLVCRVLRSFRSAAHRFWYGPLPSGGTRRSVASELVSYLLYPLLAWLAFVPSLVVIVVVAALMGFDPNVKLAALAHGLLLLWTLALLFLWVQIAHFLTLPGFWSRVRYLLLLMTVPMLMQVVAWEALDGLFRLRLVESEDLKLVSQVSRLLCLGLLPFLMPLAHARVLVPFVSSVADMIAPKRRELAAVLGSIALVGLFAGAVWAVEAAGRTALFARPEAGPSTGTSPLAVGAPHSCNQAYPELSQRIGEEGRTVLAFRVTSLGTVKDVTVVRSSGSPRLDLAAVTCVTHWTYRPATINGQRVEAPWMAEVVWQIGK